MFVARNNEGRRGGGGGGGGVRTGDGRELRKVRDSDMPGQKRGNLYFVIYFLHVRHRRRKV